MYTGSLCTTTTLIHGFALFKRQAQASPQSREYVPRMAGGAPHHVHVCVSLSVDRVQLCSLGVRGVCVSRLNLYVCVQPLRLYPVRTLSCIYGSQYNILSIFGRDRLTR